MDSVPDPNKHKNRAEVVEIYENICNQIVFILLMTGQYCAYIMLYIEQNWLPSSKPLRFVYMFSNMIW